MKKLIIAGSSKLQERAAYWRGYFEGRGYEIIDYPVPVSEEGDYAENLTDIYVSFYQNLDRTDVFFLMNEDKNDIGGYVGPSAFAELAYVVTGNLNRGKKVEINILQMPSSDQACYEEMKFWLDQNWIKIYDRPTRKKATIPVSPKAEEIDESDADDLELNEVDTPLPSTKAVEAPVALPIPNPTSFLSRSNEKTINIMTCKKRCLKSLSPSVREYLSIISPEFPTWLLKYIAAPEIQRLSGVSMTSMDYNGLYNFQNFNSVFAHSIGVALIVWRFTHDKKQTLAGLFHDIASPAFKHCIDVMNGDGERMESIEERTGEIIRNSRTIMRQLKKDGILAGEVADYHLYPIADNDAPGLAADRLEYTLSNGLFLYDIWTLDQVKRFSDNLTILKNENDIDEIGFSDATLCKEFILASIPLFSQYSNDKSRATLQFIADIIHSMIVKEYLTVDDLYVMSEREVIDWILSCGDKTISGAFREFQRATSVYSSSTIKKDRYCVTAKFKIRYTVPLAATEDDNGNPSSERITNLYTTVDRAIQKYLDAKPAKYIGFDFEFTPYSE